MTTRHLEEGLSNIEARLDRVAQTGRAAIASARLALDTASETLDEVDSIRDTVHAFKQELASAKPG